MRKAEIIRLIREKATEICDTTTERVVGGGTHGNSEVEARVLTVQYARRQGISNEDIALAWLRDIAVADGMGMSGEAVAYLSGDTAMLVADIVCQMSCDHCRSHS